MAVAQREVSRVPGAAAEYLARRGARPWEIASDIGRSTLCTAVSARGRSVVFCHADQEPRRMLALELSPFEPPTPASSEGGPSSPQGREAFVFLYRSLYDVTHVSELPYHIATVSRAGQVTLFTGIRQEFRRASLPVLRGRITRSLRLVEGEVVTAAAEGGQIEFAERAGVFFSGQGVPERQRYRALTVTLIVGTSLGRILEVSFQFQEASPYYLGSALRRARGHGRRGRWPAAREESEAPSAAQALEAQAAIYEALAEERFSAVRHRKAHGFHISFKPALRRSGQPALVTDVDRKMARMNQLLEMQKTTSRLQGAGALPFNVPLGDCDFLRMSELAGASKNCASGALARYGTWVAGKLLPYEDFEDLSAPLSREVLSQSSAAYGVRGGSGVFGALRDSYRSLSQQRRPGEAGERKNSNAAGAAGVAGAPGSSGTSGASGLPGAPAVSAVPGAQQPFQLKQHQQANWGPDKQRTRGFQDAGLSNAPGSADLKELSRRNAVKILAAQEGGGITPEDAYLHTYQRVVSQSAREPPGGVRTAKLRLSIWRAKNTLAGVQKPSEDSSRVQASPFSQTTLLNPRVSRQNDLTVAALQGQSRANPALDASRAAVDASRSRPAAAPFTATQYARKEYLARVRFEDDPVLALKPRAPPGSAGGKGRERLITLAVYADRVLVLEVVERRISFSELPFSLVLLRTVNVQSLLLRFPGTAFARASELYEKYNVTWGGKRRGADGASLEQVRYDDYDKLMEENRSRERSRGRGSAARARRPEDAQRSLEYIGTFLDAETYSFPAAGVSGPSVGHRLILLFSLVNRDGYVHFLLGTYFPDADHLHFEALNIHSPASAESGWSRTSASQPRARRASLSELSQRSLELSSGYFRDLPEAGLGAPPLRGPAALAEAKDRAARGKVVMDALAVLLLRDSPFSIDSSFFARAGTERGSGPILPIAPPAAAASAAAGGAPVETLATGVAPAPAGASLFIPVSSSLLGYVILGQAVVCFMLRDDDEYPSTSSRRAQAPDAQAVAPGSVAGIAVTDVAREALGPGRLEDRLPEFVRAFLTDATLKNGPLDHFLRAAGNFVQACVRPTSQARASSLATLGSKEEPLLPATGMDCARAAQRTSYNSTDAVALPYSSAPVGANAGARLGLAAPRAQSAAGQGVAQGLAQGSAQGSVLMGFATFDPSYIRSDAQLMRFIHSTSLIACFADGSIRAISFNSSKNIMRLAQTSDRIADYLLLVEDDPRLRGAAARGPGARGDSRLKPSEVLLACFKAYSLGEILFKIDLQGAVRRYRELSGRAGRPGIAGSTDASVRPEVFQNESLKELGQEANLFYLLLESVARESVIDKREDPLWFRLADPASQKEPGQSSWGLGILPASVAGSLARAVESLPAFSAREGSRDAARGVAQSGLDIRALSPTSQNPPGQRAFPNLEAAIHAAEQHEKLLTYYLASLEAKGGRFVLLAQFFKDTGIWPQMREIGAFCQVYRRFRGRPDSEGAYRASAGAVSDAVEALASPCSKLYRSIFSVLTVFSEATAALYGLLSVMHARLAEGLASLKLLLDSSGVPSRHAAGLGEDETRRQVRDAVGSLALVSVLEGCLVRRLLNGNPVVNNIEFFKMRKNYCLTELEVLLSWATIGVELDCEFPLLLCEFAEAVASGSQGSAGGVALFSSASEAGDFSDSVLADEDRELLRACGVSGTTARAFAVEALGGYLHAALASRENNVMVFEFSSQRDLPRWLDGCLEPARKVLEGATAVLRANGARKWNLRRVWGQGFLDGAAPSSPANAAEGWRAEDQPRPAPAWPVAPAEGAGAAEPRLVRFTPRLLAPACPSLDFASLGLLCEEAGLFASSVRLADCILQLQYFRMAVDALSEDGFGDLRGQIASWFQKARLLAPPVAELLAKYHLWRPVVKYCVELYQIRDIPRSRVFDTVVFDPSLAGGRGSEMEALTRYASSYRSRGGHAMADNRARAEDLLPFLPPDMLRLLELILRSDCLWRLEPASEAYHVLVEAFGGMELRRRLFCMFEDGQEKDNRCVFRKMGDYFLGQGPRLRAEDCAADENTFLAGAVDLMRVAASK